MSHGDEEVPDRPQEPATGRGRAEDAPEEPAAQATATFRPVGAETTGPSGDPAPGAGRAGEEAGGELSREQQQAVDALPPAVALLLVQSGANAGARFLLDAATTTAGRHPGSDIFLDDVTVSRRHAEFVREGEGFVVRDAGSLNGTYVNRERVDAHALVGGDEVQIGKYRLTYHPHRPGP